MVRRAFLAMAVLAAVSVSSVCLGSAIPTTGLVAWLNADAITGVANGGAVSTWANSASTGATYDATAVGTEKPLWYSSGIHGHAALQFDGVNDWMLIGNTPMKGQDNFTIFVAMQRGNVAPYQAILANRGYYPTQDPAGVKGMDMIAGDNTDWEGGGLNPRSLVYVNAGGNTSVRGTPTDTLPGGATSVVSATWTSNVYPNPLNVSINGTAQPLTNVNWGVSSYQFWADTDPGLGIGASSVLYGGQANFSGSIAELIFYNGAMAPADFSAVQTYLMNKYVPEPSTLALLATGLIGLLCYAWRRKRS